MLRLLADVPGFTGLTMSLAESFMASVAHDGGGTLGTADDWKAVLLPQRFGSAGIEPVASSDGQSLPVFAVLQSTANSVGDRTAGPCISA